MENNTKHTQSEILEDAYNKMPNYVSSVKGCYNFKSVREYGEACLKSGANWQSEKDKVIIENLIEALKNVVDQFSKVTPLYSKDELILKESNELLNSLK